MNNGCHTERKRIHTISLHNSWLNGDVGLSLWVRERVKMGCKNDNDT